MPENYNEKNKNNNVNNSNNQNKNKEIDLRKIVSIFFLKNLFFNNLYKEHNILL